METIKRCYYMDNEVIINAFNMLEDGQQMVLVFVPAIADAIWVPVEALEIREVE